MLYFDRALTAFQTTLFDGLVPFGFGIENKTVSCSLLDQPLHFKQKHTLLLLRASRTFCFYSIFFMTTILGESNYSYSKKCLPQVVTQISTSESAYNYHMSLPNEIRRIRFETRTKEYFLCSVLKCFPFTSRCFCSALSQAPHTGRIVIHSVKAPKTITYLLAVCSVYRQP